MTELQRQSYNPEKLLSRIQTAKSIPDLQLYGEEAKTADELDKPKLREYLRRLRELEGGK